MRYKGIEITPVTRRNEPNCNSCGNGGERWKIRFRQNDTGGMSIFLCENCLSGLADLARMFSVKPDDYKTAQAAQEAGYGFDDYDDAVWYWHTHDAGRSVFDFLGMTEQEYMEKVLGCGQE